MSKLSEASWVSVGLLAVMLGTAVSLTVYATNISNKADFTARDVDNHEERITKLEQSTSASSQALVGINAKLEILVKGYKK